MFATAPLAFAARAPRAGIVARVGDATMRTSRTLALAAARLLGSVAAYEGVTMAKQTKTTKSAPVAPVAPVAPRIARPGIATIVAAGADAAVLRLASVPKHVAGGNSGSEQALVALRAAMGDKGTCTVAEYKAARATKGMPAHVGGYLPAWVERGNVVVETAEVGAATSPKGRKGKSPKGK